MSHALPPAPPVKLKLMREGAIVPQRAVFGSSGYDLHACIEHPVSIGPGEYISIPSGIAVGVPYGYEAQIRSRSGLSIKKGLIVLNQPGTVDAFFSGEICLLMINVSDSSVWVDPGDRIAQMVICPVAMSELVIVDDLGESERGSGGFGSSGVQGESTYRFQCSQPNPANAPSREVFNLNVENFLKDHNIERPAQVVQSMFEKCSGAGLLLSEDLSKFLETVKGLEESEHISLLESLAQISSYVDFANAVVNRIKVFEQLDTVKLEGDSSKSTKGRRKKKDD